MLLLSPLSSAATTGLSEIGAYWARLSFRRHSYESALRRARETNRPLVVVGSPDAGTTTGSLSQYDCGDLPCVDIAGCERCGASPSDVTVSGAIPCGDGGAVVCVQYVLEYVSDPDAAWAEMLRAAGKPSDVFVSRLRSVDSIARVATGARRLIDDCSNEKLRYHDVRAVSRVGARGEARRVL